MLKLILMVSLFMIVYTYLIFPVFLFVITRIIGSANNNKDKVKAGDYHQSVAIVCAMYNEEKVLSRKIENFLSLNYSNVKLYIGSDGSTDRTNELLRKCSNIGNIVFFEFPRRGKVHVINDLVAKVQEDIVVFTDANSMFEPNAITALVKYFADPKIGAVCGLLKLLSPVKTTGEGFYWRYETEIKKLESRLNCVIGANGAIFAVYKRLFRPLPLNTINDDFMISMRVIEQGYGVKYAVDAIASEEVNKDDVVEFKRHIRDGAGHYRAMVHLYRLLNPLRIKIFFLYVSHRVIRWFVPLYLIILLILPLFYLGDPLIRGFYYSEICFYLLVLVGWISKTKVKVFYIPYYFIYINLALAIGFIKNIVGMQKVMWHSTARL